MVLRYWTHVISCVTVSDSNLVVIKLGCNWIDLEIEWIELELIDMSLVIVSEDFDQCSDEIDVVGFIVVDILSLTPDYTV